MGDTASYKRNVLLLAGPEIDPRHATYLERLKTAFRRAGAHVVMTGDGVNTVTLPMIEEACAAIDPCLATTFYVDANGIDRGGGHELLLDKTLTEQGLLTLEILKTAAKHFTQAPFDVFFATCAAEALIGHVSLLPVGSAAVSLSPGRLNYHDLVRFSFMLEKNTHENSDHSALGLLKTFLLSQPTYRVDPAYAMSGSKRADVPSPLNSHHELAGGPS